MRAHVVAVALLLAGCTVQPAWSDASAVAAAVAKVNNTKNLVGAARPKNLTALLDAKVASLNSTKAAVAASIGAKPARFANVIGDKAAFVATAKTALDVEVALEKIEAASKACVKTPAEYVAAFQQRLPVCVDDDLIGVIGVGEAIGATQTLPIFSTAALYFVSTNQGLERYLTLGFPASVGVWTPTAAQSFSDPSFLGLQQYSNGAAFLKAIGFPATFVNIDMTYTLNVYSKSAIRAAMGLDNGAVAHGFNTGIVGVKPTLPEVALLMEYIFAAQGLRIPSAAVDIMSKNSFASLTGCPTECAYAVSSFPSTCSPIAIADGDRTGAVCAPPVGADYLAYLIEIGAVPPSCASSPPPTFVQVAPSFFLTEACNPGFQAQLDSFNAITVAETASACPVAQAKALVAALAATTDPLTQAYAFRAFLLQPCVGDFNPLNTFNGFTATGFSGLFSPEGAEVVVSPFNTSFVPAWSKAEINFCINGYNGGQPVGTSCVA